MPPPPPKKAFAMRVFLITTTAMVVMFFGPTVLVSAEDKELRNDPVIQVIEVSRSIVSAFGADDPGTYFEYFDPAATFIFHSSPNRLQSRAEYQQEWALWRRDMDFHVRACTSSDQRVQLIGDIAILTHHVRTEITTTSGQETLHERETIVFHRRGDEWLAVHEHLSPLPEAPD